MLRLSMSGTNSVAAEEVAIISMDLRGTALEALLDKVEVASDPEKPYFGVLLGMELLWLLAADSRPIG